MSGVDKTPSQLGDEVAAGATQPEDVHVDKNIDAKQTRMCHMCPLCHTQLHKICSTDPKMAIISVAKEGEPKGWGAQGQGATSKTDEHKDSAKSKVDDSKDSKSNMDSHSKAGSDSKAKPASQNKVDDSDGSKSNMDSHSKTGPDSNAKPTSKDKDKHKKSGSEHGAKSPVAIPPGPSGGTSLGDSSKEPEKAPKWKKRFAEEEEEEKKRRKRWEEEERRRRQQAKAPESTKAPPEEEWHKKKKRDYD